MSQTIDPIKLKAVAEHLEWVLRQYPDEPVVQGLLSGLLPLIEDAKAGRVLDPVERIPYGYNFADGRYIPYDNPSVDKTYYDFATEMRGGRSEEEKQLIIHLEAKRKEFEGFQP